ncbi:MAG TPA: histidine kinase dimerization/phospho-acceptor domain-containing protein, partial [Thermodesulfovibrionales bacterium]|nr:histidine kinase dimerization/phospho-acceptor domain-containing protein [Thermodesulfovibrionales bacterium]
MFAPYSVFLFVLGYLLLLFAVAYYAERMEKKGRSLINNPYIYSLSLAVYCTSWTFYGSVGKAATSGLSFLTIYLGPTLMAALWMVILKKVVRIAKANRITTLSDFIASRYGKSLFLASLVTVVAVVGVAPYLGLQIKAIINTFAIISGESTGSAEAGLFITFTLGIFAVIFGARRLDSSERHGGLVFAIAFESIVKLLAFVAVGVFVTYGLFHGFRDIFDRIRDSEHSVLLFLGQGTGTAYPEWLALILLSMMAIMFLPRQFQMAVVENYDEAHIAKAAWLFPFYLLLMNIFVLPIAFGGLLLDGTAKMADYFVLTLPWNYGNRYLSLLAFIGGFSAATGMVIVETLALSTMVMNSIIMPALINFHDAPRFPAVVLNIKRILILGVVYLGYVFATSIGEFYSLVEMGLKSFAAVSLFAPAFFLGLYWKRGTRKGAVAGLMAGFGVWLYTLLLPALVRAGIVRDVGIVGMMTGSEMFSPHNLFGIHDLGKWGNSLFWSMLINLIFYVGFSVFTRQTKEEEIQSLIFVDSYSKVSELAHGSTFRVNDIGDILAQYIGKVEAWDFIRQFLSRKNKKGGELTPKELYELRDEAEKTLSGAIGSSMAAIIFEDKLVLTEKERGELSESLRHITESLRLSRQELAEANRNLAYLKEFSENIIESAPAGIFTTDSLLRVKYWNKEMETVTGIKRTDAFNKSIIQLLPWFTTEIFLQNEQREILAQAFSRQSFKVNVSPFKDPSGGHVVILEDITEKKKMEEELLQSSKLASIGKLTAGISHEIGNPLASISSLVQELSSLRMESNDDVMFTGESLKTINAHIERIVKIVRSLGDFARISSAEKVPSNVWEVLDRTINLVKYDRRFKNVQLAADLQDIPLLKINPDKMQQVFLNLAINALDAMPQGGRLVISMKKVDSTVEVVFSDTGDGIDESALDKIFDPF